MKTGESIPQERSSERRREQGVIKVTSSQDQIWQRTVEQNLDDTWRGLASRSFDRILENTGVKENKSFGVPHSLRKACLPYFFKPQTHQCWCGVIVDTEPRCLRLRS